MPRGDIEPFYFGTSTKPLFGCYHAPQGGPFRDCGVVLCYPMGQEYIRSHRAYRQLAIRLSSAGFPVLRFDFYGCGDSSGDCEEGEMRQWLADISTAIGEIKGRCSVVKICLVGLRFGGTLAMLVGAERGDIAGLVLWEPVVSGRAYMEELTALHQQQLRPYIAGQSCHSNVNRQVEILGFPLTHGLRTDLEKINLLAVRQKPANHAFLIEQHAEAGAGGLCEYLQNFDIHVDYQHILSPSIWIKDSGSNKGLVPRLLLQSVVSWIAEVFHERGSCAVWKT
jgi:alpha/beta superfamily hydrolase